MVAFNPGVSIPANPAFNPGGLPAFDGGGFLPNNLSGNQLWLDAADTDTISEFATLVSQWDDKSGNGNNVTASGVGRPATNVTTRNGKNVIDFDSPEFFTSTDADLLALTNGNNTSFVVSVQDATAQDYLLNITESASNRLILHYSSVAGEITFQSRTAASNPVSLTGATTLNYNIIRGRREGTTQAIAVNGGAETTNAFGADEPNSDAFWIGTRANIDSYLCGSIAEIIIYNRSLSASEIAAVESYLSKKWDIPTTLPSDISNLGFWLDAADITTITKDGSDNVSQWDDKSTNGYDVVQATGSSQPLYEVTGFNSRPTLNFRTPDDRLLNTVPVNLRTGGDVTIFVVVRDDTGTAGNRIFIAVVLGGETEDVNAQWGLQLRENDLTSIWEFGAGSNTIVISSTIASSTNYIVSGRRDTTAKIFDTIRTTTADSTSVSSSYSNNATGGSNTQLSVGYNAGITNFLAGGKMSELIMYTKKLSDNEVSSINNYLIHKWLSS